MPRRWQDALAKSREELGWTPSSEPEPTPSPPAVDAKVQAELSALRAEAERWYAKYTKERTERENLTAEVADLKAGALKADHAFLFGLNVALLVAAVIAAVAGPFGAMYPFVGITFVAAALLLVVLGVDSYSRYTKAKAASKAKATPLHDTDLPRTHGKKKPKTTLFATRHDGADDE